MNVVTQKNRNGVRVTLKVLPVTPAGEVPYKLSNAESITESGNYHYCNPETFVTREKLIKEEIEK